MKIYHVAVALTIFMQRKYIFVLYLLKEPFKCQFRECPIWCRRRL